jgi:hypothetical protein
MGAQSGSLAQGTNNCRSASDLMQLEVAIAWYEKKYDEKMDLNIEII